MSLSERLKGLGYALTAVVIVGALAAIGFSFFYGAEWLSIKVEPWLTPIFAWTVTTCLVVALPFAFFRRTRSFSGLVFFIASFAFGFVLWIWSFIVTMALWGVVGVVIGVFFMGIGVAAVAFLAALFHGEWRTLGNITILIVATFGARMLGIWLAERNS
jgi:hypothetical protein